jgi:hypothetical protein
MNRIYIISIPHIYLCVLMRSKLEYLNPGSGMSYTFPYGSCLFTQQFSYTTQLIHRARHQIGTHGLELRAVSFLSQARLLPIYA